MCATNAKMLQLLKVCYSVLYLLQFVEVHSFIFRYDVLLFVSLSCRLHKNLCFLLVNYSKSVCLGYEFVWLRSSPTLVFKTILKSRLSLETLQRDHCPG